MRILSLIFLLFTFYFLLPNLAIAQDATSSAQVAEIGYSRIHPASPFYFAKTIREEIEMKFAPTKRVKNFRQLEFATRRLREARTVLGNREDLVPETLEKYKYYLDYISDYYKQDKMWKIEVDNNLTVHLKILKQMYEKSSDSKTQMSIRAAMNKVLERGDIKDMDRLPICGLFEKESSSSALNQSEQLVLKERSKSCRSYQGPRI